MKPTTRRRRDRQSYMQMTPIDPIVPSIKTLDNFICSAAHRLTRWPQPVAACPTSPTTCCDASSTSRPAIVGYLARCPWGVETQPNLARPSTTRARLLLGSGQHGPDTRAVPGPHCQPVDASRHNPKMGGSMGSTIGPFKY